MKIDPSLEAYDPDFGISSPVRYSLIRDPVEGESIDLVNRALIDHHADIPDSIIINETAHFQSYVQPLIICYTNADCRAGML